MIRVANRRLVQNNATNRNDGIESICSLSHGDEFGSKDYLFVVANLLAQAGDVSPNVTEDAHDDEIYG